MLGLVNKPVGLGLGPEVFALSLRLGQDEEKGCHLGEHREHGFSLLSPSACQHGAMALMLHLPLATAGEPRRDYNTSSFQLGPHRVLQHVS